MVLTMQKTKGKVYICFMIVSIYSSLPISHLYAKFGERIVELTTCKVFKITA